MTAEAFDWLVNGSDDIYRTEADSLISVIGTLECCHPCVVWQKEKKLERVPFNFDFSLWGRCHNRTIPPERELQSFY